MSRFVLAVIIIFLAFIAVVFFSYRYSENISIEFAGFVWKPDVITFGLWLISTYIAAVFGFKLLVFLLHLPTQLLAWRNRLGKRRSFHKLAEGLVAYSCGRYQHAARMFVQTRALPKPLDSAAQLLLARCYLHCGNIDKARKAIHLARVGLPEAVSLDLLEAEMEASDEFPDFTIRRFAQIAEREPDNQRALDALIALCAKNNMWKDAGQILLKRVSDTKTLPADKRIEILCHVLRTLLHDAAEKKDTQRMYWLYRNSDAKVRDSMEVEYAGYLAMAGATEKAEKILRGLIERAWEGRAIECFTSLDNAEGRQRRLEQVQQWLVDRPDDAALLAGAARLYKQCGLHAQAKEHFDKSLAIQANYRVWHEAKELNLAPRAEQ